MQIETKYDVDDVVYRPYATWVDAWVCCPDCGGDKHWRATLHDGKTVLLDCPTCSDGWNSVGSVRDSRHDGVVDSLTIKTVRVDTYDSAPRYMCEETGVGSGAVWEESLLYSTLEEAELELPALVAAAEKNMVDSNAKSMSQNRSKAASKVSCLKSAVRRLRKDLKDVEDRLAEVTLN